MPQVILIDDTPIGIKLPLSKNAKYGFFNCNTDILAEEKQNFINLLMTMHGERVIHYDFGINIKKEIFEQSSQQQKSSIIEAIVDGVSRWLPHLRIKELSVKTFEDDPLLSDNEVNIKIGFQLLDNTDMFDTVQILLRS